MEKESDNTNDAYPILINRLLEFTSPFQFLEDWHELDNNSLYNGVKNLEGIIEIPRFKEVEDRNTLAWHLGRIKYFVRCIETGHQLLPIDIDSNSGPFVTDGFHRLIACIVQNLPTIQAHYSGQEDLFQYLIGNTIDFSY